MRPARSRACIDRRQVPPLMCSRVQKPVGSRLVPKLNNGVHSDCVTVIRDLLNSLGLSWIWYRQGIDVSPNWFTNKVRISLCDRYTQEFI